LPERFHRLGLAQVVGTELEDRLGSLLGPELLRPLDAAVELLDR